MAWNFQHTPLWVADDPRFMGLDEGPRAVYCQLWFTCDRWGRGEAHQMQLRRDLRWFCASDPRAHLDHLASLGLVLIYEVDGKEFWQLVDYERDAPRDTIREDRRKPSDFPDPPSGAAAEASGQDVRVERPGRTSGQDVRAAYPGRVSGQPTRASHEPTESGQCVRAERPGSVSGQPTRAVCPGGLPGQPTRAGRPGSVSGPIERKRERESHVSDSRENKQDLASRAGARQEDSPSASPGVSRVASGDGAHAPGGARDDSPAESASTLPAGAIPVPLRENQPPRGLAGMGRQGRDGMDAFEQRWGRQGADPRLASNQAQKAAVMARLEELGSNPPKPVAKKPAPTMAELVAKRRRRRLEQGLPVDDQPTAEAS